MISYPEMYVFLCLCETHKLYLIIRIFLILLIPPHYPCPYHHFPFHLVFILMYIYEHTGPDKEYRQNLKRLLEMLMKKVNHVAMVGPTFHTKMGEVPDFWDEDECVIGFIEANEEICSEVGAHYINTRKTFQTVILDEIKHNRKKAKQITEFSWDELKKKTINNPHVRESMGINLMIYSIFFFFYLCIYL